MSPDRRQMLAEIRDYLEANGVQVKRVHAEDSLEDDATTVTLELRRFR